MSPAVKLSTMDLEAAAARFVRWLDERVLFAGRGDEIDELTVEPSGRFWLGRLAPEDAVVALGLGDRGERLDPCAIGMILRPVGALPWNLRAVVRACAWKKDSAGGWTKSEAIEVEVPISVTTYGSFSFGSSELANALATRSAAEGLSAEVRCESTIESDGRPELSIIMINTSPATLDTLKDTNLYECSLAILSFSTEPFTLAALPDSFRYDRSVDAYGINCGVVRTAEGGFRTADVIAVERRRPVYWSHSSSQPDLRFRTLATDPLPALRQLLESLRSWGAEAWSEAGLDDRGHRDLWTDAMRAQAAEGAAEFETECCRVSDGIALLDGNRALLRAFCLMNEAIERSANGRYDAWRPFQVGFLLANLQSITSLKEECNTVDIVWFATGGGKTETYLGLIVTAVMYDRMRGKLDGITAWSRFPLRMLSLQQTQRFADAMAGAEMVRRAAHIEGAPFSVGFFVGAGATPNKVSPNAKEWEPNPDDPEMPAGYQVLLVCPFCHGAGLEMGFDRRYWRLEHRCTNANCPWPEPALPFYVVDDEIYRFLPSVVVGTLDKAALIALQASMRGFVGAPLGVCSGEGHGHVYAPRSGRPNGCLVPGCKRPTGPLHMQPDLYPPSFRLQDELHLLKDSLGAVDSHYEGLLDRLQETIAGWKPKILASSATLTGYQKQCDVLYQRAARVFPAQGPSSSEGFWTADSDRLARRFVAVAPRGVTMEYAVDRTLTELQRQVRRLTNQPEQVCAEAELPVEYSADLLSLYGVDVVYGNSLRDLDAVARSLETQVPVDGPLNTASLTGRTEFEEVRGILQRLAEPESDFASRVHVIAASSMMSHGVDIDRLNVMVVLGIPLTTSEFIQTTARIGRRWPGIVFVMHKIARERDASIYRSFAKFVEHGDRFVEAIPVTRRSRRVLECTVTGLELARILAVHEPASGKALTTVAKLRTYFRDRGINASGELEELVQTLGLGGPLDQAIRRDLHSWLVGFFRNLENPAGTFIFPSDLAPFGRTMISLRDVEEQVPIFGLVDK